LRGRGRSFAAAPQIIDALHFTGATGITAASEIGAATLPTLPRRGRDASAMER
jgi:hypothetical protein